MKVTDCERLIVRDLDCGILIFRGNDDDDDKDIENVDLNHSELQLPLVRSGTSVMSINFHQFRAMLIDNFNIAFHQNKLKWPKRFAKSTKPVPILAGG